MAEHPIFDQAKELLVRLEGAGGMTKTENGLATIAALAQVEATHRVAVL